MRTNAASLFPRAGRLNPPEHPAPAPSSGATDEQEAQTVADTTWRLLLPPESVHLCQPITGTGREAMGHLVRLHRLSAHDLGVWIGTAQCRQRARRWNPLSTHEARTLPLCASCSHHAKTCISCEAALARILPLAPNE